MFAAAYLLVLVFFFIAVNRRRSVCAKLIGPVGISVPVRIVIVIAIGCPAFFFFLLIWILILFDICWVPLNVRRTECVCVCVCLLHTDDCVCLHGPRPAPGLRIAIIGQFSSGAIGTLIAWTITCFCCFFFFFEKRLPRASTPSPQPTKCWRMNRGRHKPAGLRVYVATPKTTIRLNNRCSFFSSFFCPRVSAGSAATHLN